MAQGSLPLGDIWAEFEETCAKLGADTEFTQALKDYGGLVGYATLLYRAKRNCHQSAKALVDHSLGMPQQPFSVRAEIMSEDEARAALREAMIADAVAAGNTPERARALVAELRGETEAQG